MGDYLKPQRRKMGVLTLTMACVLTAGWVRSFSVVDQFAVPLQENGQFNFESNSGGLITIGCINKTIERPILGWMPIPVHLCPAERFPVVWKFLLPGIRYGDLQFTVAVVGRIVSIRYWSIVIPLTLLSAWLLLSKPRVAKPSVLHAEKI